MTAMNQTFQDERIDRLVEAVQQTNVLLEGMKVSLETLHLRSVDHEQRLRIVERWRHSLTPILASLTFLLGVVFSEMIQRWL